ncbi:hypothetical protein TIFTF001_037376 [Ficus carica]|uniref:Uncharacterized protein n=1 Tax=Ficus carica TaxID=3494 RepID=A0AA88E673_FICCA|nr:hypothetical protein TIFTF001_037376 [Ficus carica]
MFLSLVRRHHRWRATTTNVARPNDLETTEMAARAGSPASCRRKSWTGCCDSRDLARAIWLLSLNHLITGEETVVGEDDELRVGEAVTGWPEFLHQGQ